MSLALRYQGPSACWHPFHHIAIRLSVLVHSQPKGQGFGNLSNRGNITHLHTSCRNLEDSQKVCVAEELLKHNLARMTIIAC